MSVSNKYFAKFLFYEYGGMMEKEYIHYGASNLHEISPIKNEHCFTKPQGGLWASSIDAKFGWKDWCLRENFFTGKLERFFTFRLKPDAKIIHIYSIDDLENLPKLKTEFSSWTTLDFEQLAKEYDGIELHLSEEIPPKKKKKDSWNSLYFELYGWDCDSILIFNDKIIDIKK